ncbi:MAG: adenosylmethionine--8-amino-7-oxononanoate transaminase [Rubritalea sp.]|uniref:adenosylmethionine--8-amino-7-oxononanoate transaminase n=1 Tax=Rubritalea sp. TaxID=2109375 RepID=UPI0032429DA1
MNEELADWIVKDKAHCWHPFTAQDAWTKPEHEPVMLVSGDGVWLTDANGNRYIDGNSSIWTNIHGHAHPQLNAALSAQLGNVAHTSFLGYSHPLAAELAARLADFFSGSTLSRTFFSDDGSTAIECALKMALQYRMQTNQPERCEFVAFINCYHGDTMGAASLGGVEAFFSRFRKFGMTVRFVRDIDELRALEHLDRVAGVVIEPLVQGVNQMLVWPQGMLSELSEFTQEQGIHLILDEVMTGFGRTGTMFACQQEQVVPDFLCLAKGLTAGYLPMAATMVREEIYDGFSGGRENAFYYGHSYTANPLGCAAAIASLDLFSSDKVLEQLPLKIECLKQSLQQLEYSQPEVWQTRQCGMVSGIELRQSDGSPYAKDLRIGEKVCLAARKFGLLTRPVLDTIVFLPPLSITIEEIELSFAAIAQGITQVFSDVRKNIAIE